ncbi:sterol desaturase family protein [Pontibacter burrus]|uniref:Sterol desaturase family protein n=1 Tax=Pontibacter burrus TaxID=2704466 RepID=A0A6B3M081_9BACT|nr:sterol desaturase family protein [Pontibacter burrus]NEM99214.1 sterol desaturase family protein [Pontibacter burrus]
MQKELYTLDDLEQLHDLTIMPYLAPIIVGLVLAEWLISYFKNKAYYDGKDTMAALAIGAGNAVIGVALKVALFAIAMVVYNHVPWAIPRSWWGFVICFVAVDFCRYWAHRIAHEQRFWWATHVTHHSSEKMNFLISLRTGWTNPIKFVFFIPVPLLGIDPFTFFVCHQVAVLYQFFVHTELVRKMPAPIEYIFVTPSHHRVHHGSNAAYIDRNYGSTFIIWDRMLGTFQAETEKPVYGLTTPVKSYNPVYLVFHEWVAIWKDLRHCRSLKEAWLMLFSAPGAVVMANQKIAEDLNEQCKPTLETSTLPKTPVEVLESGV